MYVYIKKEQTVWTVGFYSPDGDWNSESDYGSSKDAAERVNYLNGGNTNGGNTYSIPYYVPVYTPNYYPYYPNYPNTPYVVTNYPYVVNT